MSACSESLNSDFETIQIKFSIFSWLNIRCYLSFLFFKTLPNLIFPLYTNGLSTTEQNENASKGISEFVLIRNLN